MARHLLAARTRLAVYDPSEEARRPLVELGAVEGADEGDVAARSQVVLVVVVDDSQVRAAVSASLERAEPGTVIAICASVRPDTCRQLAAAGEARGIDVVDAALVGGERGAEEAQVVLYCGGPQTAVDRVAEACAPFLAAAVRVGEVGSGQVAKTVNNILLWANVRADYEVLRLARALGVDLATLREALAIGSGANRPLAEWGKHRLRWPGKDLAVALAVAEEAGVQLPLVERLPDLIDELTVEDLRELL